ncbi:MAG TPA: hypothetical protein VLX90_18450, partial [Steroidobacteraceae bacterium]|nr:hypothetical protein [Steroidobacteraceae bacterium]
MLIIRIRSGLIAVTATCTLCAAVTAAAATARRSDQILLQGNPAGSQTVTQEAKATHAEYSFNDRGRGDHVTASWKLDAAGVPVEYSGRGNDYMKAAVAESFRITSGKATWRSRSEHGEHSVTGEIFYVPANAPPEFTGVLARALLKSPGGHLPLLPGGEARISAAGSLTVARADGGSTELTQYLITGLDFSPTPVWLDQDGQTAAVLSGWFHVLAGDYAAAVDKLAAAQEQADTLWSRRMAERLTHQPAGDLIIRNARLFDPRDLSVTPGMSVLIRSEHVVRVGQDQEIANTPGSETLDAGGRFLMPGLWDNHQHFGNNDGALDLANGVTSARDMANDTDEFLERV